MISEEKRIWGIHTKDDALFLKDNLIAIGWHNMGDLKTDYTIFKYCYKYRLSFSIELTDSQLDQGLITLISQISAAYHTYFGGIGLRYRSDRYKLITAVPCDFSNHFSYSS